MQLVGKHVSMWDSMRDRHFGPEQVAEKFGVGPEKVVEFLALAGDSSDNIPGLKGCGPKTAVALLEKYQDVEGILAAAPEIAEDKSIRNRKKISAQIELDAELVRLSRRLVQVCLEAPVIFPIGQGLEANAVEVSSLSDPELFDATRRGEPDKEKLSELVEKFQFSTLFSEFKIEQKPRLAPFVYETVFKTDFPDWVAGFKKQKRFAIDLETTSLDVHEAQVVGVAISWSEDKGYYIPVAHLETPTGKEQLSFDEFMKECGEHICAGTNELVGQNLKYDIGVLGERGYEVAAVSFDTMVAAYLLSPERTGYSLTALATSYLGVKPLEYSDVAKEASSFAEVPIEQATQYAAEDAHLTWLLSLKLAEELKEQELEKIFGEVEVPLIPVLSRMERLGIGLDTEMLSGISAELELRLSEIEQRVYQEAGQEFNLNSPKQLSGILFDTLGISTKGVKKTKTGFSTDSGVLELLSKDYELPALLLQYRVLHKLKSTYVDALPAQVSEATKRLHSRFNQTVTATGRLSSSEPNLQNIPIQTAEGRRVRKAFVADKGNVLISADYSQIELRLLAHLSGDERLIESFCQNEDIHARTAREILALPLNYEMSSEERRVGKTINFGIIYGMSAFRLGKDLGIPVGVASEYINNYFDRYPRVRGFFDELEKHAEDKGFVSTLFGRKRFLSQINTSGRDRGFVRRAAMNAPIQGSAADVIKLAMISIDARIRKEKLPLKLLLQIHDELVFECSSDFEDEATALVREEMEGVTELLVPLKVDIGSGVNWEEAH
jgi:DNA polymerase-1